MFPNFSKIKEDARICLRGIWGRAVLQEFLIGLLSALFSFPAIVFDLVAIIAIFFIERFSDNPDEFITNSGDMAMIFLFIHFVASVIFIIIASGLRISANRYYIELAKKPEDEPEISFAGLMHNFANQLFLSIQLQIVIGFASIFFIVPGVITAMKYSMAQNILAENPIMRPGDVATESGLLMDKYKGKYFLFILSFIPWFLVGILTLGIGFLWITPYFKMASAKFYYYLQNPSWEHVEKDDDDLMTLKSDHFSYKEFLHEYEEKRGDSSKRNRN